MPTPMSVDTSIATPCPRVGRFRRTSAGWVALALGVALMGCGGGGGGTSAPPPAVPQPAPMQVTATPDAVDFNKASLSWNLPAASDGVRIEFQMDGAGYQSLANLPMGTSDVTVLFDPATPERHTFGFRVTALHANSVIAQAEASYRRSLRPALYPSSNPKPASGAMGITWDKDATSVATGFLLERQADTGAWMFVAQGTPDYLGSHFSAWDLSPVAEGEAGYRIVPTFGDERGMPLTLRPRMPLLPPDQLAAAPAASGRTLTWVNQSRLATTLSIYRCTWGPADLTWTTPVLLAEIPATETGYPDPTSPTTGRVAYQIFASLPGTSPTGSNWCLAGGPSSLPDLGLMRSLPVLPSRPLLRDLDGAWMGFQMAEDPAIPPRLVRTPAAAGFPLTVPFLVGGMYPAWTVAASLASSGTLDMQMIESGPPSFGPVAVHGFRRSSNGWTSRTFTQASGLSFVAGGFMADGTILAFSVDSNWQRGMLRLALDGTATLDSDPLSGMNVLFLSPPAGTPTGECLTLALGGSGWALGIRSTAGSWTLQAIPELDPAIFGYGTCKNVLVDATGTLHALFASPILGGYRYDYLRLRAGGVAELQSLGSGGSAYGLVGQIVATADGQRVGFALMDDSGGQLRVGLRNGTGDWNLKAAPVPDTGLQGAPLFLQCGFRPDGRFWVLHNRVAHPFPVRFENYCELLEEP